MLVFPVNMPRIKGGSERFARIKAADAFSNLDKVTLYFAPFKCIITRIIGDYALIGADIFGITNGNAHMIHD